jgi:hypothetical protein
MTNIVYDALIASIPASRRTPSGWNTINAPCCAHNGHKPDKRRRGGVKLDGNQCVYNCFNCGYRAIYEEGGRWTRKMENLLEWAGISKHLLTMTRWKAGELAYRKSHGTPKITLPNGLKLAAHYRQGGRPDFQHVESYLCGLGLPDSRTFEQVYWTPDDNGMNLSRYIIWLQGDLQHATGWEATPIPDDSYTGPDLPLLSNAGIIPDDDDDDLSDAEKLELIESILAENPDAFDEEVELPAQ